MKKIAVDPHEIFFERLCEKRVKHICSLSSFCVSCGTRLDLPPRTSEQQSRQVLRDLFLEHVGVALSSCSNTGLL